jgi:hypothetical protein
MFHCCMRIFHAPDAYVVMIHLTNTWNVGSSLKTSFSANPSPSIRCWKSTQKCKRRLWSWGFNACNSCSRYLSWEDVCAECAKHLTEASAIPSSHDVLTSEGSRQIFSHTRSTVSADGPRRPVRFAAHRQPLCWNFMYRSWIVLSVGGSVWYMVWNLRCTVTIDSVLTNSKTPHTFLFPVHAMFHHDCPLAVKPASTPRRLVHKKTWRDSLPIDMLLCAVSVGCCTAEFRSSGGTYELPCVCNSEKQVLFTRSFL